MTVKRLCLVSMVTSCWAIAHRICPIGLKEWHVARHNMKIVDLYVRYFESIFILLLCTTMIKVKNKECETEAWLKRVKHRESRVCCSLGYRKTHSNT